MKRVMILLMLISGCLSAQTEVFGGFNWACLDDGGEGLDGIFCPIFGVLHNIPVSEENGSITAGVMYIGSGGESGRDASEEGYEYSIKNTYKLGYLAFPVNGKYKFGKGKIVPFVNAGAALGILLSAKRELSSTINGETSEEETDIKDELKSTNFGINVGGGVIIPLGERSLTASINYGHGLTNIIKDPGSEDASLKTRDIKFTLGLNL